MKTSFHPDHQGRLLIPLAEAARALCISRETLYRRINQGLLPEPIKQGRKSFFAQSDIEGYLSKLKRTLNPNQIRS